jgi:hypothetical protein
MTPEEKQVILQKAKQFFKEKIVMNHIKNTQKLKNISEFKINPFLKKYSANFAFGNSDSKCIAKALLYPRILGTSINTSFGTQMQYFCKDVLSGFASIIPGIDIEFVDQVDGRHKYCQIKSGPNCINTGDIPVIIEHFKAIRNLARTNGLNNFNPDIDCVVGVFYSTDDDLSSMYKTLKKSHPVYAGKEFWYRLTGDEDFYEELINNFAEVANEIDGTAIIEDVVNSLAKEIEAKSNN